MATSLKISLPSFKDRLQGALKKITDEFCEWVPSSERSPAYWSTLFDPCDASMRGMYRRSEAKKDHPVYRLDRVTLERVERVSVDVDRSKVRTLSPGVREKKEWIAKTTYWPTHDGTSSATLAHLPNRFNAEDARKLKEAGKQHVQYESADPKRAFTEIKTEEKQEKRQRKREGKATVED